MFFAIAERLNVALDQAPSVGDSLRDLQARPRLGAHPILVLSGKGAENALRRASFPQGPRLSDLAQCTRAESMILLRSLVFLSPRFSSPRRTRSWRSPTFPLPRLPRISHSGWSRAMIWLAKTFSAIHYRVIGWKTCRGSA